MGLFNSFMNNIGYTRRKDGSVYYSINNMTTNYFGGNDLMKITLESPVLSALINIRANYLSKAKFYVELDNGERDYDNDILDLLNNPNPLQSQQDFLKQYEWFRCVYGWVYQKPYGAEGFAPSVIYNLNPSLINFKENKLTTLPFTDEQISKYNELSFKYVDNGITKDIQFKDIIPFYDVSNNLCVESKSVFTSPSRVNSVIKQLTNISLASDAENQVLPTIAREMIFAKSDSSKTFDTSIAVGQDNKNAIQNTLNSKYLLKSGGSRTLTPDKELGWVDMSIKAKDLGLHESINSNSSVVAQAFGVPNEIYQAYKTGATFENQEKAEFKFIQNVIQPIVDDLASSYTDNIGNGLVIKGTLEHLPTMQIVEVQKADKILKISTALKNLQSAGLNLEESKEVFNVVGLNLSDE